MRAAPLPRDLRQATEAALDRGLGWRKTPATVRPYLALMAKFAVSLALLPTVRTDAMTVKCSTALRNLQPAKLDLEVRAIWGQCPCKWTDPKQRGAFQKCALRAARALVAKGELPLACLQSVVRSATRSTCGLLGRGATCCTYPPIVPQAVSCRVLTDNSTGTAGHRCVSLGGSLGASPSCYDACAPPGMAFCAPSDVDARLDAAMKKAEQDIARAQGAPFNTEDPEQAALLLALSPYELPCYTSGTATRDSLPDLSLPPRFRVDAGRPGGTGALSRP